MEEPQLNEHHKKEHPPMHTTEHILNQTMIRLYGCPRSKNTHIEKKKGKCDYLLPHPPSVEEIEAIESKVNEIIRQDLPVTVSYISRGSLPEGIDLSKLPEDVSETLRIVMIGDYDTCACLGSHVAHTGEIGRFKIISHQYEEGVLRIRFKLLSE